jgi:hypothetical protein
MKATKLKNVSEEFTGEAWLYRLEPPHVKKPGFNGHKDETIEYVVSSATVAPYGGGPETYLFWADEAGEVLSWLELDGSFRGALDCDRAVRGLGYEVVP